VFDVLEGALDSKSTSLSAICDVRTVRSYGAIRTSGVAWWRLIALFYAHYVSHRPLAESEPRIDRLDFGSLSRYLSICLALLAATVSVISSYLFGAPPRTGDENEQLGKGQQ
jgi:hypothetical protein